MHVHAAMAAKLAVSKVPAIQLATIFRLATAPQMTPCCAHLCFIVFTTVCMLRNSTLHFDHMVDTWDGEVLHQRHAKMRLRAGN
jgi:cobalamin synthase